MQTVEKTVEIDVDRVLAKTEAAFLVEAEGEEFWLPVSQLETLNIDALDEAWRRHEALSCLQIPAWLADKIGLEGV